MSDPPVRFAYTDGTGKPAPVIIIEVDPDNPVVSEPIVSPAGEPGPIVVFRYRSRTNDADGQEKSD